MTRTAVLFFCATVLVWWLSTGLIMMSGRASGRRVRHAVAFVATVLMLGALVVVGTLPDVARPWSVGVEFLCALTIWAWVETTLYTGVLAGPVHAPFAEDASEWTRFVHAFRANAHHEVAIVLSVVATMMASVAGGGSGFAPWAVATLAAMHESARLNVLLGVRNLNADLLPAHLDHFRIYFRERNWNALFPFSLAAHALAVLLLAMAALAAGTPAATMGYGLLAGIVGLGFLEHVALMLPFRPEMLWGWAMERVG